MHDFQCRNAEDMYSEVLAGRVRELKETQEGVDIMCEEMRELMDESYKEGETRAKIETARSLARMGMPVDNIALAVNSSVECVQKWLSENVVQV